MTGAVFVKRYGSPERAAVARLNREWLSSLHAGVRLPVLRAASASELVLEHLGDRHPGQEDLAAVAQALGRLHAVAYDEHLHACRLDEPFTTHLRLTIRDFHTPRRRALTRMPLPVDGLPVALYKDANIRNFVLTDDGVAVVDFDDLTLAPFGYDLAKLVVSAGMTYGRLDPDEIALVLREYNDEVAEADSDATCSLVQLRRYAEFHHLLTSRYLYHNGYRHSWLEVNAWPDDTESGTL